MRKVALLLLLFVILTFFSVSIFAEGEATPTTATPTVAPTAAPTTTVAPTSIMVYIEKKIELQRELSSIDIQIQRMFSAQFEKLGEVFQAYATLNNKFEALQKDYTRSYNSLKTSLDKFSKGYATTLNTLNAKLDKLNKDYLASIQTLNSNYDTLSAKVTTLESAVKDVNSKLFLYVAIGSGAAIVVALALKFLIK